MKRNVMLYIPSDKVQLMKKVRVLLKAQDRSLSQLFLECLERYAEAHREELEKLEELGLIKEDE